MIDAGTAGKRLGAMLTDAEIAKLRELIARPRPADKPYYWCHAVDGPLAGEKVALSMRLADCLRRHQKTATIHFGLASGTGWIAAVYRPAGVRKLKNQTCQDKIPEIAFHTIPENPERQPPISERDENSTVSG